MYDLAGCVRRDGAPCPSRVPPLRSLPGGAHRFPRACGAQAEHFVLRCHFNTFLMAYGPFFSECALLRHLRAAFRPTGRRPIRHNPGLQVTILADCRDCGHASHSSPRGTCPGGTCPGGGPCANAARKQRLDRAGLEPPTPRESRRRARDCVSSAPPSWTFRFKGDLRNYQAIAQPRLYDCLMLTQITLLVTKSGAVADCQSWRIQSRTRGLPLAIVMLTLLQAGTPTSPAVGEKPCYTSVLHVSTHWQPEVPERPHAHRRNVDAIFSVTL
jgi:hypothetical protein